MILIEQLQNIDNLDSEIKLTLNVMIQRSGVTIPEDTDWYWRNVEEGKVCLQESDIFSLEPLESLDNIRTLVLFGNRISNIAPLSKLQNLRHLNLIDNNIKFLDGLENLKLEELYLGENLISDVSLLSQMQSLRRLGLRENQITNLTPLESLTNLIHLNLSGNPVEPSEVLNLQGKLPGCKIIFE